LIFASFHQGKEEKYSPLFLFLDACEIISRTKQIATTVLRDNDRI